MAELEASTGTRLGGLASSLAGLIEEESSRRAESIGQLHHKVMQIQQQHAESTAELAEKLLLYDSSSRDANELSRKAQGGVQALREELIGRQHAIEESVKGLEENQKRISTHLERLTASLAEQQSGAHATLSRDLASLAEGLDTAQRITSQEIHDTATKLRTDIEARLGDVVNFQEANSQNLSFRLAESHTSQMERIDFVIDSKTADLATRLELGLQVSTSSLEGSLKTQSNGLVLRAMGEQRQEMRDWVASSNAKLAARLESDGTNLHLQGMSQVKEEVLAMAASALDAKIEAVQGTRARLWEESLPRLLEDTLSLRFGPRLKETSERILVFEGDVEGIKREMAKAKHNAQETGVEIASRLHRLATESETRSENGARHNAEIETLRQQLHRSEERNARQYESCRQAIHVIAAAINERAAGGRNGEET